jgi:hypothetical protein
MEKPFLSADNADWADFIILHSPRQGVCIAGWVRQSLSGVHVSAQWLSSS